MSEPTTNPQTDLSPQDYSRFYVSQAQGRFSLLDEETGWVWKDITRYSTVLVMMRHILSEDLKFHEDEYKRLSRLEGREWEAEIGLRELHENLD